MSYIRPEKLHEKLTSEDAKAAFYKINALKPDWDLNPNTGKTYLSLTIDAREKGNTILNALGGWKETEDVDERMTALWEKMNNPAPRGEVSEERELPVLV
ncbi:MAG: hypothetical protein ACT4OY_06375 [Alphaproteobacteria bacterium]